jgi:hypothetical protein
MTAHDAGTYSCFADFFFPQETPVAHVVFRKKGFLMAAVEAAGASCVPGAKLLELPLPPADAYGLQRLSWQPLGIFLVVCFVFHPRNFLCLLCRLAQGTRGGAAGAGGAAQTYHRQSADV